MFVLAFILMMYFALRALRRMNCRPKYIPGKFLKDKWNRWPVGIAYGQVPDGTNAREETGNGTGNGATGGGSEMNTNSNVRRDTSVRSVITLPAYSSSPKPEEQIIAREGERGGMDVVTEFPETAEEEEARREELMESLYQVRQQRRQEIADRETRRQERRDARARGDYIRLEQLRIQSRARAESHSSTNNGSNTNLAAAISSAEHQSRGRDRRISSVSYAELGQVRHDGSRVRARSPDSDRHPLLSNAASINTEGPDRSSGSILTSVHSRGESYSSMQSDFSETDALTRPESHAQSTHSGHSAAAQDGDVGGLSIPPPDYEHLDWGDAPPYESPTLDRGEQPPRLRELTPLPTIHIDVASPVNNTPTTPTNPQAGDQNHPPQNPTNNQPTSPS